MKGNGNALNDSSNASSAAFQELATAYQELATKNMTNMTAAFQAFSAVKSSAELMELQQRLMKDGMESAVGDCQHIAQLTIAMGTAGLSLLKIRRSHAKHARFADRPLKRLGNPGL